MVTETGTAAEVTESAGHIWADLDSADVLLPRARGGYEAHVIAVTRELMTHLAATEADAR